MSHVRLTAGIMTTALTFAGLTGCGVGSAAKQVYYEIRGAKTEIMLVSDFSGQTLKPFRDVRIGTVTTTLSPRICPPKLVRYYNEYLAKLPEQLREVYPGGEPVLLVNGELLYYQPKGLLSGALSLLRVRMIDQRDQHVVVDAIVRTENKSFREGGRHNIAESAAQGLEKFLREQRPIGGGLLDEF